MAKEKQLNSSKNIKSTTVALILFGLLVVFRLLIETLNWDWTIRVYPILLFILVAGYMGIREQRIKSREYLTYIMELKAALRPAALLAFLYSLFSFIFYRFVSPGFFNKMIVERRTEFEKSIAENNVGPDEAEKVLQNFEQVTDYIFSPLNWATFTLLGLIMLSFVYGALLVLFARKFPKMIQ